MNVQEFAKLINGREYRNELTREEIDSARDLDYLIAFGYSDDLIVLQGFCNNEAGAYDGGFCLVDRCGIRKTWDESCIETECEARAFFERKTYPAVTVDAEWGGDPTWIMSIAEDFETALFDVMRDGEVFCRGIIVDCSSLVTEAALLVAARRKLLGLTTKKIRTT